MDPKHHDALPRTPCQMTEEMRAAQAQQARLRQAAAAFLRAARMTEEPAEREALKRKAAELLLPRSSQEPPAACASRRLHPAPQETRTRPRPPSAAR